MPPPVKKKPIKKPTVRKYKKGEQVPAVLVRLPAVAPETTTVSERTLDCGLCTIVNQTQNGKPGFMFAIDGEPVLLNDYPDQGGPWSPAIYPNGNVVWVNQGG